MGFWRSTTQAMGGVQKSDWKLVPGSAQSDAAFFIDCLEKGQESDMSVADGAEVLKVLLAAYESAAKGQAVDVA